MTSRLLPHTLVEGHRLDFGFAMAIRRIYFQVGEQMPKEITDLINRSARELHQLGIPPTRWESGTDDQERQEPRKDRAP